MMPLKGMHYTSSRAYKLQTFCKLREQYSKRFEIAAEYISHGETILDVCAGTGELAKFLPQGCSYMAVEASLSFAAEMEKNCIGCNVLDLHKGISLRSKKFDTIAMIISLCQFRNTSVSSLLEDMKEISRKVVIVEDVLKKKTMTRKIVDKAMNYLCATGFYVPTELFTRTEFANLMQSHGYQYIQADKRYAVGLYQRAYEK